MTNCAMTGAQASLARLLKHTCAARIHLRTFEVSVSLCCIWRSLLSTTERLSHIILLTQLTIGSYLVPHLVDVLADIAIEHAVSGFLVALRLLLGEALITHLLHLAAWVSILTITELALSRFLLEVHAQQLLLFV